MKETTTVESKIRRARKEQGFTIVQLSHIVGIGHSTLSYYEVGKSTPSEYTFTKIKTALNLPGEYDDYFDPKQRKPRKKKYGDNDLCKKPGCKRKAQSKGLCQIHYVNAWRKKKGKEKDIILQYALEKLSEMESKTKK